MPFCSRRAPHPREDALGGVEQKRHVLRGELLDPEQVAMRPHASGGRLA